LYLFSKLDENNEKHLNESAHIIGFTFKTRLNATLIIFKSMPSEYETINEYQNDITLRLYK